MSDLISRKKVLTILNRHTRSGGRDVDGDYVPPDITIGAKQEIKELPPEQPEPKKGKWIGGSDERFVKCSECGMESTKNALMEIALFGEKEPHFCPNCGSYNGGMEHGIIKHHYQNPIRRKKNDSD